MKLNRKSVTLGLAGFGLAGLLAGGGGIAAAAATGTPPTVPAHASVATGLQYGHGNMSGIATDMPAGAPGIHGLAFGENAPVTAAGTYLGLSRTDLQTQLQAGKSLADVARAQGKSVTGLEAAMVTAITSRLDANTALSADQRSAILAQAKSHIDTIVNTTHHSGAGVGPLGTRMNGMGR